MTEDLIKAAEHAMRIKTLEEAAKLVCVGCAFRCPLFWQHIWDEDIPYHLEHACDAGDIHVELKHIKGERWKLMT